MRRELRAALLALVEARTGTRLDPDALTIGFARRFATYKRADLVFSDLDRLQRILDQDAVQIVFAGKAHPRDGAGQDLLARVLRHAGRRSLRDRVVFVPDYDIQVGRALTSGSDVWLNNPRRPHEASGTSGQKGPLNGGINFSVLDGWWAEAFQGDNGWAIGDGQERPDRAADAVDAESLYAVLEEQILPEWRARDATGLPERWLERVRASMRTCIPAFNSHRMVQDYARRYYAGSATSTAASERPTGARQAREAATTRP